jgi:hypothetical protein
LTKVGAEGRSTFPELVVGLSAVEVVTTVTA